MNLQQTKLGLVLESVNLPINLNTFNDRLILQKAVYLLQEAGVDMGYRFRWYLRGPYSSGLTEDAFSIDALPDKGQQELAKWELDESSLERINRVRGLFSRKQQNQFTRYVELIASTLFLIKTRQVLPDNPEGISKVLKENNKPYEADEVSEALEELKKFGYAFP